MVDLLFMGELAGVSLGLEEGIYSWDELDQPHDVEGNTPLISACLKGLNMVSNVCFIKILAFLSFTTMQLSVINLLLSLLSVIKCYCKLSH